MDRPGEQAGWHVVVGATGGTGGSLVRQLVERGRRVRAVSRRGTGPDVAGVEQVAADATDAGAMRAVCAGAEVVYHCVNPPLHAWTDLFPRVTGVLLEASGGAGARLVFADDTWMYGRVTAAMTERTPYRPVSCKGVLRAWLAEMVLAAHARGDVRVAVGRAGELYGPGVESLLGPNLFRAALAGRRAWWFGSLDKPLTPCFIDDFARGLMVLGERDEALGAVWHIPAAEPVTGRQFVDLVSAEVGRPVRVSAIPSGVVRGLKPFVPLARQGAEMIYQFEQAFVVDATRFRTAFGDLATAHPEGIRRTVAWYRGQPGRSVFRFGR